jgi:hypothetical protein
MRESTHRAVAVLYEAQTVLQVVAVARKHAHDHVAVAVNVLGHAVDHNVGTELQRVLYLKYTRESAEARRAAVAYESWPPAAAAAKPIPGNMAT